MDMDMDDKCDTVEIRRQIFEANPHDHLSHSKYKLKECDIISRPKNSKSVLDICGVRVVDRSTKIPYFVCLTGDCFSDRVVIRLTKTSTCHGTAHCSSMHSKKSKKTEVHQRHIATIAKHLEVMDKHFNSDPLRWFQITLSAFAVQHSISYRAFESDSWTIIASKLPVGSGDIKSINIRKHYVEHYVAIK